MHHMQIRIYAYIYIILYYVVLYNIKSYHIKLYYIILNYIILYYIDLCGGGRTQKQRKVTTTCLFQIFQRQAPWETSNNGSTVSSRPSPWNVLNIFGRICTLGFELMDWRIFPWQDQPVLFSSVIGGVPSCAPRSLSSCGIGLVSYMEQFCDSSLNANPSYMIFGIWVTN